MKDLTFILLLPLICAFIPKCDIYDCGQLPDDQCVAVKQNEKNKVYTVQTCRQPLVCNTGEGAFPWHCNKYASTRVPGEYCEDAAQCVGGKCEKSLCRGYSEGFECAQDKECDYGLYCHGGTKKCRKTLEEGSKCAAEEKCGPFLVCNETCIQMGSLENNKTTVDNRACKSYYSLNSTCKPGPTLLKSQQKFGPTICTGACFYTGDNGTFRANCTCGRSNLGVAYCNLGAGDFDLVTVTAL